MAPNTHCSLFQICHSCIYFHAYLENYRLYMYMDVLHMDVLHMEQLLHYQRHSLCGLELYERSNWRAMAPDTHHGCSLTQHCPPYTASLYIHCYLVHNYACMSTKLTQGCSHTNTSGLMDNQ